MLAQHFWILILIPTAIFGMDFHFNDLPNGEEEEEDPYVPDVEFSEVSRKCRVSGGRTLESSYFELYTCAVCYRHVDDVHFKYQKKFKQKETLLKDPTANASYPVNASYPANVSDTNSPIWDSFASDKGKKVWVACCKAAVVCCQVMSRTKPNEDPTYCPRTWDGWDCWPDTPPGKIAQSRCPSYVYFHSDPPDCQKFSTKVCTENGTWFRNLKNTEWSNYTSCGQTDDMLVLLKNHIVTFSISIICILPALFIFNNYKQLQVFRISMHKNLFVALLLNGVSVIIFEAHFKMDFLNNKQNSIIKANEVGCKLFYTLTYYLRLCTYVWMFCEGFYLHKLIVAAFAEQKSMLMFWIMGWVFPIVPVGIWAILRQQKADYDCWTIPANNFEWIMFVPMLLALVMNFCFLANIIRVLVAKLRSTHTNEPAQFRRAVRATLVLIPLFGIHFFLMIYHPINSDCWWKQIHTNASYAIDGLQGCVVSLIFCYLNKEVIYLLKRSYNRRRLVQSVSNHYTSGRGTSSRMSVSTNIDAALASENEKNSVSKATKK